MKRAVIFILVVALLLGIGYIGLSPRSDTAEAKEEAAPKADIELVTIVENEELGPEGGFSSEWLDVKDYRYFKLYARLTPYEGGPIPEPPPDPPAVFVNVNESPLGGPPDGYGHIPADFVWQGIPCPEEIWPQGGYWAMAVEFEGLYSEIHTFVVHPDFDPEETRYISLYLLMAKE